MVTRMKKHEIAGVQGMGKTAAEAVADAHEQIRALDRAQGVAPVLVGDGREGRDAIVAVCVGVLDAPGKGGWVFSWRAWRRAAVTPGAHAFGLYCFVSFGESSPKPLDEAVVEVRAKVAADFGLKLAVEEWSADGYDEHPLVAEARREDFEKWCLFQRDHAAAMAVIPAGTRDPHLIAHAWASRDPARGSLVFERLGVAPPERSKLRLPPPAERKIRGRRPDIRIEWLGSGGEVELREEALSVFPKGVSKTWAVDSSGDLNGSGIVEVATGDEEQIAFTREGGRWRTGEVRRGTGRWRHARLVPILRGAASSDAKGGAP